MRNEISRVEEVVPKWKFGNEEALSFNRRWPVTVVGLEMSLRFDFGLDALGFGLTLVFLLVDPRGP